MLKLRWTNGRFTSASVLADLVEKEKRLIAGLAININGERCFMGVVHDYHWDANAHGRKRRSLTQTSINHLREALGGNLITPNDNFIGTPEERCKYMADLLRSL